MRRLTQVIATCTELDIALAMMAFPPAICNCQIVQPLLPLTFSYTASKALMSGLLAVNTSVTPAFCAQRFIILDILWVNGRSAGIPVAVGCLSCFDFPLSPIIFVDCFMRHLERLPIKRNQCVAASDWVQVIVHKRSLHQFIHTFVTVVVVTVT